MRFMIRKGLEELTSIVDFTQAGGFDNAVKEGKSKIRSDFNLYKDILLKTDNVEGFSNYFNTIYNFESVNEYFTDGVSDDRAADEAALQQASEDAYERAAEAHRPPPPPPTPINCKLYHYDKEDKSTYQNVNWTGICDATCGTGNEIGYRKTEKEPEHGGDACPADNADERKVEKSCENENPCVDLFIR